MHRADPSTCRPANRAVATPSRGARARVSRWIDFAADAYAPGVNRAEHHAVVGAPPADERQMLDVPAVERDSQHHRLASLGVPGAPLALRLTIVADRPLRPVD